MTGYAQTNIQLYPRCAAGVTLFRIISFSAWLSRVRSATRCLRRLFSSSSCRSRRSSLTSSPPYRAFHR
jgi:hypothetical protein